MKRTHLLKLHATNDTTLDLWEQESNVLGYDQYSVVFNEPKNQEIWNYVRTPKGYEQAILKFNEFYNVLMGDLINKIQK